MAASYNCVLHYCVKMTCLSPLRTGSAERNTEKVLKNHAGLPLLQGTSLVGALRNWKEDKALWGSSETEGQVIVSDAVFERVEPVIRPRVMLNAKTGSVSHKYDLAALPRGTVGRFEITWRGQTEKDDPAEQAEEAEEIIRDAAEKIEKYLSALNSGAISLGAQKANGFGMVSLEVSAAEYNLRNKEDRTEWLRGGRKMYPVALTDQSASVIRFTVHADTDALLVKAATEQGFGDGGLKGVQISENGVRFIPGSAIKGAIRAHLERIAPYLEAEALIEQCFGRPAKNKLEGISGRLRFSDGKFDQNTVSFRQNRIRINRLTGGVFNAALFPEEYMHGHVSWEIRVPADCPEICALLLFALRDLYLGLYNIGGGYAIGRGQFESMQVAILAPDGKARLEGRNSKITMVDSDGVIARWRAALEERKHEA